MKQVRVLALAAVALATGCAHLGRGHDGKERETLWREAHIALGAENFRAADTLFASLAMRFGQEQEGREAVFYLGAMRLDPRNPGWNSRAAADHLRRYLTVADTGRADLIYRRPEATTLLELANQLNMPEGSRIPALQPDTVVRTRTVPGRRVIVPAEESRALGAEVERLRRELAERDETIRAQREELNRIRRTLTPGRRP